MLTRLTDWWRAVVPARETAAQARQRLAFDHDPAVIYAIGDVHGCLPLVLDIEKQIVADARSIAGEKWIVLLGDVVDRGPLAAQVIDHLLAPPPTGFTRYCLAGNHEALMLEFLADPRANSPWLELGGWTTLMSYGVTESGLHAAAGSARRLKAIIDSHIPQEHVAFLESLPVLIETPSRIFVHAGLVPGVPLAEQTDDDLLWFRDDFAEDYAALGRSVAHGHAVTREALIHGNRVALDTGGYSLGRLSAARFTPGEPPFILTATARRSR